ncbi:YidC/Oxa1 family membrane protein insertase [Patescibacteria group bacterium]|nr:YidC/Oxa1 family membrane protein insertase [Patescibacteria group bacterium]
MNPFVILFYQPIINLLVFLHNTIPGDDFGWAIIGLTIIIKLILLPLSAKSLRSQKALQDIQPKVDELRKKFKDNKEAMGKELMMLYKKEKVSPFSSCLPLLVQLPFLLAIFQVLRDGISNGSFERLYPFVSAPETVNTVFLGIINLETPSIALALTAGALQFGQTRMLTHKKQPKVPGSADEGMTSMMNKQMMYMAPVITVVFGATLPGGLTLYWTMNTLTTLLQQIFVLRKKDSNKPDNDIIDVAPSSPAMSNQ